VGLKVEATLRLPVVVGEEVFCINIIPVTVGEGLPPNTTLPVALVLRTAYWVAD
jgi:hypothetical protein